MVTRLQRLIVNLRVTELGRLFHSRHGDTLPNNTKGRKDALLMIHHLAALKKPVDRITKWLDKQCPWMPPREVKTLLYKKPKHYRAATLGRLLSLTYAERKTLQIKTIRTFHSPGKRQSRAEYLASVASARPWEAQGVSRATWYRRRTNPEKSPEKIPSETG